MQSLWSVIPLSRLLAGSDSRASQDSLDTNQNDKAQNHPESPHLTQLQEGPIHRVRNQHPPSAKRGYIFCLASKSWRAIRHTAG